MKNGLKKHLVKLWLLKISRKHLILALSIFQFAFWLYVYIYIATKKKKHWEVCREPTHPRGCWRWSGRRTCFCGGLGVDNLILVPRDYLAKLRSARARLLSTPVFTSTETRSQDGLKSGGVVQGFLYRHPGAPPPPPSCSFPTALLAPCLFACWT
jgi:hypothetical protein